MKWWTKYKNLPVKAKVTLFYPENIAGQFREMFYQPLLEIKSATVTQNAQTNIPLY